MYVVLGDGRVGTGATETLGIVDRCFSDIHVHVFSGRVIFCFAVSGRKSAPQYFACPEGAHGGYPRGSGGTPDLGGIAPQAAALRARASQATAFRSSCGGDKR